MQCFAVLGQAGQRGFGHRLQCATDGSGTGFSALAQRLLQRDGQTFLQCLALGQEFGLAGQQTLIGGRAVLFKGAGHRLQAVDQGRQGGGLCLQQAQRFGALPGLRIRVQVAGNGAVQLLHGLQAVAAQQGGQQAEHGRAGHARDRGTECHRQALHRRGQRAADGGHVGGALQGQAGATQRVHHAQQGAEHAQQHQQADQVGGQHRCGQSSALALHAQAHGVAQAQRHAFQPGGKALLRAGQVAQCAAQAVAGLAVAVQLHAAGDVAGRDDRRHRCTQRMHRNVADADPAHGQQADKENNDMESSSGHGVPVSGSAGRRAALRSGGSAAAARQAAACACHGGRPRASRAGRARGQNGRRARPAPWPAGCARAG